MLEYRLNKGEDYRSLIGRNREAYHDQRMQGKYQSDDKIKGIPFQYQKGHGGLTPKKSNLEISEDLIARQNHMPLDKSKRFQTVLDFKKSSRKIDFGRDLPRRPFYQSSQNAVGRYARSYNVNWKGVQKRQDVNCLEFGKTKGRDWNTAQYQPSTTDGYYDVIEYVANKEANTKRGKSRDRTTTSRFNQTSSEMRSTGQRSKMTNSKSGYVIDFKKNLPRSISQQSKLPTFMQKGTSCSRFSVEHIRADPIECDEPRVNIQQTPYEEHQDINNSFDKFFGDS